MKKILLGLMSLALLASTPVWAGDECNCSKKCKEACAKGANADCDCKGCNEGGDCKNGSCNKK